jgi:hypothetical protein
VSILVEFQGKRYWYLGESLDDLGHALAPLDHCDENGNVKLSAAFKESYAHVAEDGRIRRYRMMIGLIDDLKRVTASDGAEPSAPEATKK